MATAKQIAANQANAQKSTGPKTEAGKAKSSLNHLSHGFTSNLFFMEGENQEEFQNLLWDLMQEHLPASTTEQILVEKMASNHWLSLRAIRLQSMHLIVSNIHEVPKELGLLIRYQTASDRAFHKAHAELLKAQKERQKSAIGFESKKPAEPVAPPAEEPQKPAAANEKPEKPPFRPAHEMDFAACEAELAWVITASLEEIQAMEL
jgi:hypothetical protein